MSMKHGRHYTIALYGINSFDVVLICANSHDRINVRLNENERMGKKLVPGKKIEEKGVDEYRRVGKNRKNGKDIIV